MSKGTARWLKGLANAVISGAVSGAATAGIAPDTFNFREGLGKLVSVFFASAVVSIGKYLLQNPLFNEEEEKKA